MPTPFWSHVAALMALALAGVPGLAQGQSVPGIAIDRAEFIVSTTGPDGRWTSRGHWDRVVFATRSRGIRSEPHAV